MTSVGATARSVPEDGRIGRIPIRNLWLLMLYASDAFATSEELRSAGAEESPDELPDLVARLLADAVERRLRRQLGHDYRWREAALHRVRGRIDLLRTERRQLLERGLVACRFEELSVDSRRNRFVRAALEKLVPLVKERTVAHRCRSLAGEMKAMGVVGKAPTLRETATERLGHNDRDDRFMLSAARLAYELSLPTEHDGPGLLSGPKREVTWLRLLFEKAVGGFYAAVLDPAEWRVYRGRQLDWQIEAESNGIAALLPSMITDVVLENPSARQQIVIDTKFTSIVTKGRFGNDTLRSNYLYQLYAYLRSQVGRGDPLADRADGLLLHPAIEAMVDEKVVTQGHALRFATVDLAARPAEIRGQLLRFAAPWSP